MGSYTKQIEQRQEHKERDRTRREKLAGFFYDLAKLCFGGLVVGYVISYSSVTGLIEYDMLKPLFGIASTIIFSKIANDILK